MGWLPVSGHQGRQPGSVLFTPRIHRPVAGHGRGLRPAIPGRCEPHALAALRSASAISISPAGNARMGLREPGSRRRRPSDINDDPCGTRTTSLFRCAVCRLAQFAKLVYTTYADGIPTPFGGGCHVVFSIARAHSRSDRAIFALRAAGNNNGKVPCAPASMVKVFSALFAIYKQWLPARLASAVRVQARTNPTAQKEALEQRVSACRTHALRGRCGVCQGTASLGLSMMG